MCLVKHNQNMTGCLGVKRFPSHQLLFWMVLLIVGYIMLVLSSVGVKTRIFKTSSNGSTWPIVMRRRLSSEQNEAPASNITIKTVDDEKVKILYIVTSGGKSNSGNDRFQRQVGPVVLESVESLNENAHWHVDVFLVLGFDEFTLQEEFEKQLHEINPNIQLRTWIDALPIFYGCESWEASRADPVGGGTNCRNHEHNKGIEMSEAALFHGKSQLARQHRFVVKDFLSEYDFFLAFEDDMLINKHHVEYHMEWMAKLRRMAQEASNGDTSQVVTNNDDSWRVQALTSKQLVRLRPGLLRVEVVKDDTLDTPLQGSLDVGVTDAMVMEASSQINASRCCHRPVHVADTAKSELSPKDLILWEAGIFGFGIRKLGDTWIGTLPGPTGPFSLQDFWSGRAVNRTNRDRPRGGDPKLIAQSAGWMASRREVLEYNEYCNGGFLPPFDVDKFPQDGLFRNNVEFWSGGIQMWSGRCNIPRFVDLQQFDRHLIYHTSNNKQVNKASSRLVSASVLLAQLYVVLGEADSNFNKTV